MKEQTPLGDLNQETETAEFIDLDFKDKVIELKKQIDLLEMDLDIVNAKYDQFINKGLKMTDEHARLTKQFDELMKDKQAGMDVSAEDIQALLDRFNEIENDESDEHMFNLYKESRDLMIKISDLKAQLAGLEGTGQVVGEV